MNQAEFRQKYIVSARRIVIKVGSAMLTGSKGLDIRQLGRLVSQISNFRDEGRDVVLISSGAIASGFKKMGLTEKPKTVRLQQACAAIGQAGLMMSYERAFEKRGHKVAQILLTADDLVKRDRYLNARNTMAALLEWHVIPIVNENDTVKVNELKFGDNDTLGSMIAELVEADLFIILTDIDGLYDTDPRQNKDAAFIPVVETVGPKIEAMASQIPGALGAGGMYTKVMAARRVARRGVATVIANGKKNGTLTRVMKGEPLGTLFLPQKRVLTGRKHWIAFTTKPRGKVVVDDGARRAVLNKGKSLLPSGVTGIEGRFGLGDCVEVKDRHGELLALGLTNYSSDELRRISGCQTCDIEKMLGYKHADEVIHRDNMVVGDDLKV